MLGTYTEIAPEVAAELTLPNYQTEINRESVERLLELGVEDGIIPEGVSLDEVLVQSD